MKIALYVDARLPVAGYGGTERVVWSLGKALARLGHEVTFLAARGTVAPFARVVETDPSRPVAAQIPEDVDIVHFQNGVPEGVAKPYVVTIHGNMHHHLELPDTPAFDPAALASIHPDPWAIFVSCNNALRHGCTAYVHNGLDWDDYPAFEPGRSRKGLFFLGKAAWKVKNLQGAIHIARMAGERLDVLGGHRLNLKMGFRLTLSPRVVFHGMVGNPEKARVANGSRGLVFPVKWHEPFGLAVVESLYYGSPVFATPTGALPELVGPEFGVLSHSEEELARAVGEFCADERRCHEYAAEMFSSEVMARNYLRYYERRLASIDNN